MKHEWRKSEKEYYIPGTDPIKINVPSFKYYTIEGKGNPNDDAFSEYIGVLYALSYAIKMSPQKGISPAGYFDYTVYPLEGVWDISEEAKQAKLAFDKNNLVFKLMIRQPDFVKEEFAAAMLEQTKSKKPHSLLDQIKFESITEGACIQMMHLGSYDSEPISFKIMEEFAKSEGLMRKSKVHREVYLSDARKVASDKLKTVLRFKVEA